MLTRAAQILTLLALVAATTGCDPVKRVPPGRHLLVRTKVHTHEKAVDRADLNAILKQKPNKRILGLRFYLWVYNLPDPDRIMRRKAVRIARLDERNARREARGKAPKTLGRSIGEWLRGSVGEAPVLLDSNLTLRSTQQLELYMRKEGWFDAVVTDTTLLHDRRAEVRYTIRNGPFYRLRKVTWTVDDPAIDGYMRDRWEQRLLRTGDRFDADKLDAERDRIVARLRELGYLFFTRDMVTFDADTAVGDRQVDVVMRLARPRAERGGALRGSREGTIHYLEDITIDATGRETARSAMPPDTLIHDGYVFLYRGKRPVFKPRALLSAVFLKPDDRYQQSLADLTYRRLTNLRVTDRVDMIHDTTNVDGRDRVDLIIRMQPSKRQSFALEGFGTNRGGFLGTSVSFSYRHRNLFRSMGSLQAQLTLGLEAQQSIAGTDGEAPRPVTQRDGLFNTVEIGPEINLRFPQFLLPIRRERFSRASAPRTNVGLLYNYQRRPDYTRSLFKTTFGYEWSETRTKTWLVNPLELNVIKIPYLTEAFRDYLRRANDPVLLDSYTDHLILGGKLMYTYNTQETSPKRNVYFARFFVETSGNLVHAISDLFQADKVTDSTGSEFYTIAGIRYAQFVKLDGDLRYYRRFHEKSSMALRLAGGVGVPYGNLGVLPFETSYFVGGANGLRAWRARSVGPGSFSAPLVAFDRIGEMRLEANVEYRFHLIAFFEGALFADAGNIWFLRPDERRPGGHISRDFLGDVAIGTGLGLRLNFDFFLVRFDLGLRTKDPAFPAGQRWLFQAREARPGGNELVNLNLGIGYPF